MLHTPKCPSAHWHSNHHSTGTQSLRLLIIRALSAALISLPNSPLHNIPGYPLLTRLVVRTCAVLAVAPFASRDVSAARVTGFVKKRRDVLFTIELTFADGSVATASRSFDEISNMHDAVCKSLPGLALPAVPLEASNENRKVGIERFVCALFRIPGSLD